MLLFCPLSALGQKVVMEQDQRLKKDKFYYEHTDLTYLTKTYQISKSWDITPFTGYRLIYENKKGFKSLFQRPYHHSMVDDRI